MRLLDRLPPFRKRLPAPGAATTDATGQAVAGYWAKLRRMYQQIDRHYFPEAYRGSAVVLWPQASPWESLSDARYWWERICPKIEFGEIPGHNVTCLTRHVDTLAQALVDALQE